MTKSFILSVLSLLSLSSLSTSVSATSAGNRSIIINNYCGKTVWFQATSGSAPFSRSGIYNCATDSDCIVGSHCNANVGTPLCFWNVPTPNNGNYRVPAGSSNRIDFPILNNGQDIVWSGNIVGCLDGTCSNTVANCDANGCGVSGAVNLAEMTLAMNAVDFYDVSVINGVNIPMELAPDLPHGFALNGNDPYRCGNPGGNQMITSTPSSPWVFNVPHIEYYWVSTGGVSCASDADCVGSSTGTKCGLSDNVGQSPRHRLTCGNFMGYWTADQVCGEDPTFGAPFYCSQPLANAASASGLTLWNQMACTGTGVDSCYANGASTACCGCVNWNNVTGVAASSLTEQCVNSNPEWTQWILPQLTWLKTGCPTCYSYPYDDMSSTFVCSVADPSIGQLNLLNYELNFCPNNKPVQLVPTPPSVFNATIVNTDYIATINPAITGSGATVTFSPVAACNWVVFSYIVHTSGSSATPVTTSVQMTYSTATSKWNAVLPDPGEGSSLQYSFNYLFTAKTSPLFTLNIPAAPSVYNTITTSTTATTSTAGGVVTSVPAPPFTSVIIPNTNTTHGAVGLNIQFNTTATAASWVITHFTVNGGGAQNVQMSLNTALSSTVWNYFIPMTLANGTSLTYSFTYMLTGQGAVDSAQGKWVYVLPSPPAPTTIATTTGVTTVSGPTAASNGGTVTPATTPTVTYTYTWIPGAWSACDCTGKQTRASTCQRNDGATASNSLCSGSAPSTSQSCTLPASCAATTSAPGSTFTTTDFTATNSYAASTQTDLITFVINPSINYAASWVNIHYTVNGGGQINVQMTQVSASSSFTYSVTNLPPAATLVYSFTYFLNGFGAKDSTSSTYVPTVSSAASGINNVINPSGSSFEGSQPEVMSVTGNTAGSSSSPSSMVVALVASLLSFAVATVVVAGYTYRQKLAEFIKRQSGAKAAPASVSDSAQQSQPLATTSSVPKATEMRTGQMVGGVQVFEAPTPASQDLLSPSYRQELQDEEERQKYASQHGVVRRTSV